MSVERPCSCFYPSLQINVHNGINRTLVRHVKTCTKFCGHLSDTDICPTISNLTSNLYFKKLYMLKGLYQVIIDKHEQGIEANCGN